MGISNGAAAEREEQIVCNRAPVQQVDNAEVFQIDTMSKPVELAVEQVNNDHQVVVYEQRTELPFKKDPADRPSVWKILKDAIGKDLSRFCVPVYFNEPISMV